MKMLITLIENAALSLVILTSSTFADNLKIINKDNKVVDIEFYKPIDSPLFVNILKEEFTFDQIDSMLVSSSYMSRALAAAVLAKGRVADTAKCVELLVNALDGEINHPFSTEPALEVTATITEFLLEQYMYDFRVLLYTKGSELIKPYLHRSGGDLRKLLILVAGLLGDKDVRDDIGNIYLESENGFIRAQAIHVMNIFPDLHDIPVLKRALKDEYHTEDEYGNEIWRIRNTATGALILLGFNMDEIKGMRNNED